MSAIRGHWMRSEPLNRRAWPNYRAEAESDGLIAVSFVQTVVNGSQDTAYLFESFMVGAVRRATRSAWIVIFGDMTLEQLQAEGF